MHFATKIAFVEELAKISARKNDEGRPARLANNFFGLPYHPDHQMLRRGVRQYEEANGGTLLADRSQNPIGGQSTASLSQGGMMNPVAGV